MTKEITAAQDAKTLASLRVQLGTVADSLTGEPLAIVNAYLAQGASWPLPEDVLRALTIAGVDMNEVRFLLGEIERVTTRAEHPHQRKVER